MKPLVPSIPTLSNKSSYHSNDFARVARPSLWRKYLNLFSSCLPKSDKNRHRLSTIMNADRIVVVEHGKIVEQGNHSELIVANGRYADLWSKQVFLRPRENLDILDFIDDRPAIADDLSSEQTATELGRHEGMDSDSEIVTTDEGQPCQGSSTLGQHRKEV